MVLRLSVHGERLPRACLTVADDASIEPFNYPLYQPKPYRLIHLLLTGGRIKDLIENKLLLNPLLLYVDNVLCG